MQVESEWEFLTSKLRSLGFTQLDHKDRVLFIFTWDSKIGRIESIKTGIIWEFCQTDSISTNSYNYTSLGIEITNKYSFIHIIITPASYTILLSSDTSTVKIFMKEFSKTSSSSFKFSLDEHILFMTTDLKQKSRKLNNSENAHLNLKTQLNHQESRLLNSVITYSIFMTQDIHQLNEDLIYMMFGRDSLFYTIAVRFLSDFYFQDNNSNKDQIDKQFKKWFAIFEGIYELKELTVEFYINHIYYSFLLINLLYKSNSGLAYEGYLDKNNYNGLKSFYQTRNLSIDLNDVYIFGLNCKELIRFLYLFIPSVSTEDEDLFGRIYQDLISTFNRQASGEFYSPNELISLMIEQKLLPEHKKILDPACGSGSFLVEVLKKIKTFQLNGSQLQHYTIYGIDINPLAVLTSQVNIALFMQQYMGDIIKTSQYPKILIYFNNALFPSNIELSKIKVNFIIGNPPWVNISGLYSDEYKIKIKQLANQLNLLLPVEAKNTELCAIFFYQIRELYLEKKGKIFLILPASVLNGRQYVFFRSFFNFSNVEAWFFDQDLFKIHSICLFAEYVERKEDPSLLTIKSISFKVKNPSNHLEFEQIKEDLLKPIYVKWHKSNPKNPMVGRFNPVSMETEDTKDISPSISPYYTLVKGGLRIVPRRWVVLKNRPPFSSVQKIYPDLEQDAKPTWNKPPYESFEIEKESIHPFLKSDALIPFTFVRTEHAFLPITNPKIDNPKGENFFDVNSMPKRSQALFKLIDAEYQIKMKTSASMSNFSDNLTYNSRLLPTTFYFTSPKHIMVVHNSIGSNVKAAIVRSPIILDNSLYFFLTDNETEAYYLTGILNSSIMTLLVKKIGSTGSRGSLRNIHKNPYNFPITKFENNTNQRSIAEIAKKMEAYTISYLLKNYGHMDPSASETRADRGINSELLECLMSQPINNSTKFIQKALYLDKKYIELRNQLDTHVVIILSKNET